MTAELGIHRVLPPTGMEWVLSEDCRDPIRTVLDLSEGDVILELTGVVRTFRGSTAVAGTQTTYRCWDEHRPISMCDDFWCWRPAPYVPGVAMPVCEASDRKRGGRCSTQTLEAARRRRELFRTGCMSKLERAHSHWFDAEVISWTITSVNEQLGKSC